MENKEKERNIKIRKQNKRDTPIKKGRNIKQTNMEGKIQ